MLTIYVAHIIGGDVDYLKVHTNLQKLLEEISNTDTFQEYHKEMRKELKTKNSHWVTVYGWGGGFSVTKYEVDPTDVEADKMICL